MDYIIFGIGSGASLILFGWMLREWGPSLRDRTSDEDVLSASDLVMRMAWARFCATSGMALVLCGCLILIATAIAAALAVSDDSGAMIVLIAFVLAAPMMLLWLWLYLRQFGAYGVIRRRTKLEPTTEATPVPATEAAVPEAQTVATPEAAPEPSFTEAVSSPGGLGRFAAFFRQDSSEATEQVQEAAYDNEAAEDWSDEDADDATATDEVIAEITGETGAGESKRLDPSDPLVTDVYGERADTLVTVSDDAHDTSTTGDPSSSQEAAMDTLRKRRIARLAASKSPDRDS